MVNDLRIAMLFLVGFSIAGSVFIMITDGAEGVATVESQYTSSTNYPANNYLFASEDFVHTKNNTLLVTFVDSSGNLMAAHKELIDDDWNYSEIAPYNFGGMVGPWRNMGSVNTDNGSVVVGAVNLNGATYYDQVYLWSNFLGDEWDTWDDELIITSSVHYTGSLAINDTDIICVMLKRGNSSPFALYYETFDFGAYDLGHAPGQGTDWGEATKTIVQVIANVSGMFHFFWQDNANIYQYRDLDKVIAKRSIPQFPKDVMCLINDMFILSGASANDVWYMYQTDYGGAFTTIDVSEGSAGKTYNYNCALGITDNSTTVRIVAFDGTDDTMRTWTAAWDAEAITWQNSEATTSVARPGGYIRIIGNQGALWPKDDGNRSWSLPTSGWVYTGWDEVGTPDDYYVFANGITWYGDLTIPPPEITDVSLPDAEYGVFYSHILSKVNGTPSFTWSLQVGPEWMSIGSINGTIYGTPDGTGTETVKVRLADIIPRIDDEQWTLTIGAASEGEESEFDPSVAWALWWGDVGCISSFMVVAVIVLVGFLIIRSRI